jgi:multisubunit Na+/H+ antiporter MnhC subunit
MTEYLLCLVLLALGVYCILAKRNLIKIIVGLVIVEVAINQFFVLIAYKAGGQAPIIDPGVGPAGMVMVDPLPHALVLTAIVIGLATTAMTVAIAMRIYDKYRTYDIDRVRELRG